MPFPPGKSGNPSGRPTGSRSKATLAMDAMLDGEAGAITRKAIDLALAGEAVALRLCIERIIPPRKDRPVWFALPELKTAADAVTAFAAIAAAVAEGDLTPSEASELSKLVDAFAHAFEITELERRLTKLEKEQIKP